MNRWWIYQSERFPFAAYATLAAVTGIAAVTHSALLRGQAAWPDARTTAAACASALAFFVQMRVADEFKDSDDDARWRPERPVPRGLVRLRELAVIAIGGAAAQVVLAGIFGAQMLVPLLALWSYFALMCAEFGVPAWLKARPGIYLLTHLPIAGLILLQLSAFDWLAAGAEVPPGLAALLATACMVAALLEIGRKLRAPADERPGVVTYTAAWGIKVATAAWSGALALLMAASACAAWQVGAGSVYLPFALLTLAAGLVLASRFVMAPSTERAARLDLLSRLATLLAYIAIGPAALVWKLLGDAS